MFDPTARWEQSIPMTPTKLRSYTCKDLAEMAKREGVAGWHAMRKEELVRALARRASNKARAARKGRPAAGASKKSAARKLSPQGQSATDEEAVKAARKAKRKRRHL